jgi:hypothetical protein
MGVQAVDVSSAREAICHSTVLNVAPPPPGEVTIDLAQSPLDEEAEWHYLTTYKGGLPDRLKRTFYQDGGEVYAPSRFSESPVSDFEDGYSLYRDRLEVGDTQTLPRVCYKSVCAPLAPQEPRGPRGWHSSSPPGGHRGPDCSPPARRREPRYPEWLMTPAARARQST